MSLSSVCVVTNALRLRFFKSKVQEERAEANSSELTDKINNDVAHNETETSDLKGMVFMKKVLTVDGMMCAHCQMHVQKALEGIDGVIKADVELETKKAHVELSKDVSDDTLMNAVKDAGYTPVDCTVE